MFWFHRLMQSVGLMLFVFVRICLGPFPYSVWVIRLRKHERCELCFCSNRHSLNMSDASPFHNMKVQFSRSLARLLLSNNKDDTSSDFDNLDSRGLINVQYVEDVIDFSSQYGHDKYISYTALNVIGPPTIYPNCVESARSFTMRTYGPWSRSLPSANFVTVSTILPPDTFVTSDDFVEVKYEESLYPLCMGLFENYNPGALVRILGYCHETMKWKVLWQSLPVIYPESRSCITKAVLEKVNFKTNRFRLEFSHEHLMYHYQLEAIAFVGRYDIEAKHFNHFDVSPEFINLKTESQRNVCDKVVKDEKYFEKLPQEVIHFILSHLDLKSLCCASQVSKFFKEVCYDPVLYKNLDLQPYWYKIRAAALEGLQERCCFLQYLNLSWCGSNHSLSQKSFTKFIERCKMLTTLKLSKCSFVNDQVLKSIVNNCTLLQALELRGCSENAGLNYSGFCQIGNLEHLVYLDLYHCSIDDYSAILIIKSCRKIEHLFLGSCLSIQNFDGIALEISSHLGRIKTLELWRSKSLTHVGVSSLAESCNELVEIDLGWCLNINANTGCLQSLIRNCTKIRKLCLAAVRTISDEEMLMIATYSQDLEQLDVLGSREISLSATQDVLRLCKKLKFLDVTCCQKIENDAYETLKINFPHVQIKKSIQPD